MPDTPIQTWTIAIDADTTGLEEQIKTATLSGKQFSSALSTAFDGLAIKGKSLGDVFNGLALSLSKSTLQNAFKPLENGLGDILSGLFSGSSAFANGGVFQNGIPTPFASGGVIQSPIAFPIGSGGTGIAGRNPG